MKTPWLCLATLAAAENQILCVVPSRWPPSRSLEAVASTWLKDCDDVAIAVSTRQYNASRSASVARRKSARKFITRNVAVTHDGAGFTPWALAPDPRRRRVGRGATRFRLARDGRGRLGAPSGAAPGLPGAVRIVGPAHLRPVRLR